MTLIGKRWIGNNIRKKGRGIWLGMSNAGKKMKKSKRRELLDIILTQRKTRFSICIKSGKRVLKRDLRLPRRIKRHLKIWYLQSKRSRVRILWRWGNSIIILIIYQSLDRRIPERITRAHSDLLRRDSKRVSWMVNKAQIPVNMPNEPHSTSNLQHI